MITKLIGKLLRWDKLSEEHFEEFMKPQLIRGLRGGIPAERLDELGAQAVRESDFVAVFPASRLRDLIDMELVSQDDD